MKIDLYKQLCSNFNKQADETTYLLWNEMLEEHDPYYVEVAIKNIIKNDKFFPTFSRILEEINNLPELEIPDEEKIKRMKAKGIIPSWLDKEIVNEEIDKETEDIFNDFNSFIEDFRNEQIS